MANRLTHWIWTLVAAATLSTLGPGDVQAGRFLDWCSGRSRQTTEKQVLYYPTTAVVAGYAGAAPTLRQPTVAYSFPTGTYPPYPTSPSPLYSSPRFQAPAPTAVAPVPTVTVPAATAPSLAAPTASSPVPGQALAPQTVAYPFTPRVTYRTVWAAVPVTSYRPVTSGSQTLLRPCNRWRWQARRVPQTALRPMVVYAPQPATTSYAPQSATTSYAPQSATTSYAPQPATTSYAMPPATTSYAMPPATTSFSLPTTTTHMPLMSTVQPAAGTINSTTAYDAYGSTTAWSGYSNGAAFSPPVAPAPTAPSHYGMGTSVPAGVTTVPQANYPTTHSPPGHPLSGTTAPVAPPGYTYQLVPNQPAAAAVPPAGATTPSIPLSPVPADTRPRLENYPSSQKQTLMRPQVQMRRVQPEPAPTTTGDDKSPFDLLLDPPSKGGSATDAESGSNAHSSGSQNAFQEANSSSHMPAAVAPVRPRLQPIPFPRSLEGTSPIESAPQLIRPRSHTAATDSVRYAAVPIHWPPRTVASQTKSAGNQPVFGKLSPSHMSPQSDAGYVAPAQHQAQIIVQESHRDDFDDGGWAASTR